ncbi:MAG: hypothetical protein LBU11_07415 [Zoogloeaceae bacterium]|nr:hypothetical protein [Zoogloeaceae bacterium]
MIWKNRANQTMRDLFSEFVQSAHHPVAPGLFFMAAQYFNVPSILMWQFRIEKYLANPFIAILINKHFFPNGQFIQTSFSGRHEWTVWPQPIEIAIDFIFSFPGFPLILSP